MACLLIVSSCQITTNQKVQHAVKVYLDSTLNDPKSYESVSFGKIYYLKDTVVDLNGKPDTLKYHGSMQVLHTYRAKNAFGAVITKTEWFQIDSTMRKAECCFDPPFNSYSNSGDKTDMTKVDTAR